MTKAGPLQVAPARQRAVEPEAKGVVASNGDFVEFAGRRLGLLVVVSAPAGDGGVGANAAGEGVICRDSYERARGR